MFERFIVLNLGSQISHLSLIIKVADEKAAKKSKK